MPSFCSRRDLCRDERSATTGEIPPTRRGMELAQVLRRSENAFVGVASGLLDQFSSLFGRAHHAVYLDCQDARARPFAAW